MAYFHLKQSTRHLTSTAGLMVIGQGLLLAELERLDVRLPKRGKIPLSGLVKGYVALLTLGKSDVEAIEAFRQDAFLREAWGLPWVPGSVWLRQPLAVQAAVIRDDTDDWRVRRLRRSGAPVTADDGYVCLDFDTFVMDNGGTQNECVGRTYQGVDGYTPIAADLGNAGWCLGLELRPGVHHSALETHYCLERVLPRVAALTPGQAVLARSDSGFDSARRLFQQDDEQRAWAVQGRTFAYLVKGKPRRQDLTAWAARAEAAGAFVETRPGKRTALLDLTVERAWGKDRRPFRWVVRLTERTIDKHGQHLLLPVYQLEGWWTSRREAPEQVIRRYQRHGTHEQFHAEIKTDLDLERLPSGKFDGNDRILQRGRLADNGLRLLGQRGLTGAFAPGAASRAAPAPEDRTTGHQVPGRPVHSASPATLARLGPHRFDRGRLCRPAGGVMDGGPITVSAGLASGGRWRRRVLARYGGACRRFGEAPERGATGRNNGPQPPSFPGGVAAPHGVGRALAGETLLGRPLSAPRCQ